MGFSVTYKQLLEVEILHNYFLNDGATAYSTMSDADKKRRLKLYDILEFLDIVPSLETAVSMRGHKLVFKVHGSGFSIYAKVSEGTQTVPFIALPDDLKLKFVLKVKDSFFGNYTDLTLGGPDVFYFGNIKPSTEGGSFSYIPKSADNVLITDAFKLSANGSKDMLDTLKGQNKIGVFGIVELQMIGDSAGLNVLTVSGNLKSTTPVFKVHFDNRKTQWRYKRVADDTEIFTTATNPLTKYGFIEVEHNGDKYPNPSANHLILDNNNFFSEIYI